MLSSGKDIEARVFAVFECRRVPCRNPWDTKRATAGSSGGAELCRILLVFVSQREISVLGERSGKPISTARAHARCIDEEDGHYFLDDRPAVSVRDRAARSHRRASADSDSSPTALFRRCRRPRCGQICWLRELLLAVAQDRSP